MQGVCGRADWPFCALGHLRVRAWAAVVSLYLAAQVAPIVGWPDAFTAHAFDSFLALKQAVNEDTERRMRESRAASGGPSYSGRER